MNDGRGVERASWRSGEKTGLLVRLSELWAPESSTHYVCSLEKVYPLLRGAHSL